MTAPYPPQQPGEGYQPYRHTPVGYTPSASLGVPGRRVVANPAGIVIALVSGAAVLIGAFVDWYPDVLLGDIVNALDVHGAKAFPKAYFGWLMWVVLGATVVAALFANLPIAGGAALRFISPVLGLAGAAMVLASLNELIQKGSVFDHGKAGLYLVLAGFVAAGFAGVLGPRRAAY